MAVLPRGIREIEMTKYDADWVAAETAKRAWMAENGMYSEAEEHASCGVGLVVSIDGQPSRTVGFLQHHYI